MFKALSNVYALTANLSSSPPRSQENGLKANNKLRFKKLEFSMFYHAEGWKLKETYEIWISTYNTLLLSAGGPNKLNNVHYKIAANHQPHSG